MSNQKGALTPLAVSHADVLRHIHGHPNAKPAQIAEATGRIASNVKRDLPKLAEAGFIALAPLVVTPEGEAVIAALDRADGRLGSGAQGATSAAQDDSRVGSGAHGATSAGVTQSDVLMLRHDQIRPNPLNLRKAIDEDGLAGLADAIEAAGDVLQNLVVFPADAEGVHTLSAGERRWRAVGLLIEQGRWSSNRPLRAIQRENTPGQTSFIALVENGQRQNLSLIEEAFGYQALVLETGWSAREAALRTGRDPRTVQEMLKILREADPADIARHQAGDPDMRWEDLRNSVKSRREARGVQEQVEAGIADYWNTHPLSPAAREQREQSAAPIQADIEAAAPSEAIYFSQAVQAAAIAAATVEGSARVPICGRLSGGVTAEGEAWPAAPVEHVATPWDGWPRIEIALHRSDRDRWAATVAVDASGFGFRDASGVWSNDPVFPGRAAALRHAVARLSERLGDRSSLGAKARKVDAWLAEIREGRTPAPAPAPAAPPPIPVGGAGYSALPRPDADKPLRQLSPLESLAMIELAWKLRHFPEAHDAEGAPLVSAPKYWLDATASELRRLGLVVFLHTVPGARIPHVGMPKAGRDWIEAKFPGGLQATDLEFAQDSVDIWATEGEQFLTPWLNAPAEPAQQAGGRDQTDPQDQPSLLAATDSQAHAEADEEEVDDPAAAEALLAEVSEMLLSADDFDRAEVFARLGIAFPLRASQAEGLVTDANGRGVFTVDPEAAFLDPAVAARVLALVTTLNAAVAEDSRPIVPAELPAPDQSATAILRSITVDEITCLEDGRKVVSLRAHLKTTYGLTPAAYRARWGLPADYPMLSPRYAQARHEAGGRHWSW